MEIREIIREIVREVLREELSQSKITGFVRDALLSEVTTGGSTKPEPEAPKNSVPRTPSKDSRPYGARKNGVEIGQRWVGKINSPKVAGRIIQIAAFTTHGIMPRVIKTMGKKKSQTKEISFEHLRRHYSISTSGPSN